MLAVFILFCVLINSIYHNASHNVILSVSCSVYVANYKVSMTSWQTRYVTNTTKALFTHLYYQRVHELLVYHCLHISNSLLIFPNNLLSGSISSLQLFFPLYSSAVFSLLVGEHLIFLWAKVEESLRRWVYNTFQSENHKCIAIFFILTNVSNVVSNVVFATHQLL